MSSNLQLEFCEATTRFDLVVEVELQQKCFVCYPLIIMLFVAVASFSVVMFQVRRIQSTMRIDIRRYFKVYSFLGSFC